MRAVGYKVPGALDRADAFVDIDLPKPSPSGRDLLVEVKAVSVNPVDTKVRRSATPPDGEWKVLGWDATGVVVAAGPDARLFKPGDEVFYAGSIDRSGSNAEFQLVDERIVGRKPASLDWAEAAALPLTAITAWEALFDRLEVNRRPKGDAGLILIPGGGGGVASIAVQLARRLTDLTVIATASRLETEKWIRDMGAHHVIDHRKPLAPQVEALGLGQPSFVFSTTFTSEHAADFAELMAPQGRLCLIDELTDISAFKRKAVSIHWEFMYARPLFGTADLDAQHELLNEVSRLVDAGTLRTTLTERFSPIDAATLKEVHRRIESNTTIGKLVLEGFR